MQLHSDDGFMSDIHIFSAHHRRGNTGYIRARSHLLRIMANVTDKSSYRTTTPRVSMRRWRRVFTSSKAAMDIRNAWPAGITAILGSPAFSTGRCDPMRALFLRGLKPSIAAILISMKLKA